MAESDRDDSATLLVGRLIRSYRDDSRRNGRHLTQEGLLALMVEKGEDSAAYWDRSMISNWERGVRHPPREFLVAFGRALNVPQSEIDHIMALAGYENLSDEEGRDAILAAAQAIESQMESLQHEVRNLVDSTSAPEVAVDASAVAKNALMRLAPPGIYALVVGFILNALGQNGTMALLAFVLVGFAIVVGQWASRRLKPGPDRSERDHIVDLFFLSVLFTLNASLLIGAIAKTDHFGFYTIEPFTNTPLALLATFLTHLALSLVASVMFSVLWSRQYGSQGRTNAYSRAVWATLPPILFTYVSVAVFANLGSWISLMVIHGILFGAFTVIVALNDPETSVKDVDFVLKMAILAIVLLSAFGVAGTLIAYMEPDILVTSENFRFITLPEVSAENLGYTSEEGLKLMRLGNLWMSLANILYLATVLGGYLLVTIRRAAE